MNRYYGSTMGRFPTPDPFGGSPSLGRPGSWNRYAYVEGDPVNNTDRSGLFLDGTSRGEGGWVVFWVDLAFDFGGRGGNHPPLVPLDGPPPDLPMPPLPPTPLNKLSKEQCNDLTELLAREQEHGTQGAALKSGNTLLLFSDGLLSRFNSSDFKGVKLSDTVLLDLDWFTDLTATVGNRFLRNYVGRVYEISKSVWNITNQVLQTGNDPGWPYQDTGESTAVKFVKEGKAYKDIFTKEFMDRECWDKK